MGQITTHYKTAKASEEFNPWTTAIFPSSTLNLDRFEMPKKWQDIVRLCYFFYERDGLVKSIVDKQVEIAINSINIITKDMQEEEARLFKLVSDSLLDFLSVAGTEYYISGLVIPEVVWGRQDPVRTGLSKDYVVPADLWIRDPSRVELKSTPFPNHVIPLWTVSSEDAEFIKNKGVYTDGTSDKETYELFRENFPDYVSQVQKGITAFPLTGKYVLRRKPLLRTPYPVPYLMPALELLVHKRNLRAMDYALIGRVINAIMHVKVGNDTYPLTENDQDIIDDLEREFNRGSVSARQRLFQLFTNHTVEIDWVIPNLDPLLNTDKYEEVNREILYALGFPKFLITGEKDKSNTGSSSSALLSPVNSMKSMRKDFINFLCSIFVDMAEKNGFSTIPEVSFGPLNLIELSDLLAYAPTLESSGIISKTSLAELAGFDFQTEQLLRMQEKTLMEEYFPGEQLNEEDNPEQHNQDTGEV